MLQEATLNTLQELKLHGMVQGFQNRAGTTAHAELSHADFVGLLAQDEKTYRENLRLKRLLLNAKLRQQAALEDIDYRHPRGLTKQAIAELSNPQWIGAHRNVLISGPTGIGKSFIACAVGNLAARGGYTVLYTRAPRMFESLQQTRGDGSHLKALMRLGKVQLLVIDDLLVTPLAEHERRDLLEIVEDRYATASTVITSQCPPKDWHQLIGDATIADAICDRLFHNAYRIALKGPSVRCERAKQS
jgi:DNA replication protein DnaC